MITAPTAPPQIDTVPSSITDDGLEDLFNEFLACENRHAPGNVCTVKVVWRWSGPSCRCSSPTNVCQQTHDNVFHSARDGRKFRCTKCRSEFTIEQLRKGWVAI